METNAASRKLHTDQVSKTDILDRLRFANEISLNMLRHVKSSDESLVIGIHGPWGSGKSNLLYFIKENIEKDEAYLNALKDEPSARWVEKKFDQIRGLKKQNKQTKRLYLLEFNPWMFSGKEQLHYAFLNAFALKVNSKSHKLRNKVESFAKKLHWVAELGGVGDAAKEGASAWSSISIEDLKNETNQILIDEDIHVIIFIDDIDRLTSAEMLEVFQLVKLNANFKNTLFLISFDKYIVTQAIHNTYQIDGDEYLEKIIQVDYSVPAIPLEILESMFFERLKTLLGEEVKFNIANLNAPWLMYGLRFFFNSIRDLNRYFNSVAFRLPAIQNDINIHDFLIIEAVRLFDYDSYEIIRDNYKENLQFGDRTHFKGQLNNIPDGPTKQVFDYLLGPNAKTNILSNNDFRIHDTEYFERYFTLSLSKKDLREEEFNNFVLYPPQRLNVLAGVIRNKKIQFLLRRLIGKAGELPNVDLMTVVSPLVSVWSDFHEDFVEHWRTVWDALKAIAKATNDTNAAYRKLIDEFSMATSDFSPARFTFLWLTLQNVWRDDERNIDPDLKDQHELFLASKEKLERVFKLFLENYQSQFFFGNTYNDLYQRIFFQSYARLLPDKYPDQFRQLMNDDQRIFIILDKVVFREPESRKPVSINQQLARILIPVDVRKELLVKLKAMNPDTLSKENANTLRYFLKENQN